MGNFFSNPCEEKFNRALVETDKRITSNNEKLHQEEAEFNYRIAERQRNLQDAVQEFFRNHDIYQRNQEQTNSCMGHNLGTVEKGVSRLQNNFNNLNTMLAMEKSSMENKLQLVQLNQQQRERDLQTAFEQGHSSLVKRIEMDELEQRHLAKAQEMFNMKISGEHSKLKSDVEAFEKEYASHRNAQNEINKQLDNNIRNVEAGAANLNHKLEITELKQTQMVKDVNSRVEIEKANLEKGLVMTQQEVVHGMKNISALMEVEKEIFEAKLANAQLQQKQLETELTTLRSSLAAFEVKVRKNQGKLLNMMIIFLAILVMLIGIVWSRIPSS